MADHLFWRIGLTGQKPTENNMKMMYKYMYCYLCNSTVLGEVRLVKYQDLNVDLPYWSFPTIVI